MTCTYHGITIAEYKRTEHVSWEHFSDWMSYYTHHSDTNAPQYVHVDVPSDDAVAWMFYYKHHSNMDSHQCVHVDVPSDVAVAWMYYYKHHSDTDASQYVHIDVP